MAHLLGLAGVGGDRGCYVPMTPDVCVVPSACRVAVDAPMYRYPAEMLRQLERDLDLEEARLH